MHRDVIKLLGGPRKLSSLLGHKFPTTCYAWQKSGHIPYWRWHEIIDAAAREGVSLTYANFEPRQEKKRGRRKAS